MRALALALLLAVPAAAKTDDIPPGYRAVSLELPAHELHYLVEGARVDFLVTFEAALASGPRRVTATLLQNVIARKIIPPRLPGEPGTAQIYLNPNEALYFALSTNSGKRYTVIARGRGDNEMVPMEMTAMSKLVGRVPFRNEARKDAKAPSIPAGERAFPLPLPLKTLLGVSRGSRVDVYAKTEKGRVLAAHDALVLDVRPPAGAVAQGTAWLSTSGRVAQDLVLVSVLGHELSLEPVRVTK